MGLPITVSLGCLGNAEEKEEIVEELAEARSGSGQQKAIEEKEEAMEKVTK